MLKSRDFIVEHYINMYLRIVFFFFLRFAIFEIIFVFSFWNKNFKRIDCKIQNALDRMKTTSDRSSCSRLLFKTGDLKNSAIFPRKVESLFNKTALKFFIEKRLQHRYFPVNIKLLGVAFVVENWWLLSTWLDYILWMINELIASSSRAMLQVFLL